MVLNNDSWPQQIRNLFSISSLIFFSFLVYQVVKANLQFLPEKLYVTEEQLTQQLNKEFHAANTLNSITLVEADQQCKPGESSGVIILPNYPATHEYCECKNEIFFKECSQELMDNNNYSADTCKKIDPQKVQRDFVFLLESDAFQQEKKVKFCWRQIDSTKFGYILEKGIKKPEYTKECIFSDTHKVGFVDIALECPSTRLGFRCKDNSYKLCETDFYISCIKLNLECPVKKCAHDEIGCFSKVSQFCLKNTEQCPFTEILLVPFIHQTVEHFEEQKVRFKTNFKLLAQRSNINYDYIERLTVNFNNYPHHREEAFYTQFKEFSFNEFQELNQVKLRYVQHTLLDRIYSPSYQRRNHISPNRVEIDNKCSRTLNMEYWNQKMLSIYNLEYPIRVWLMRFLFVKLFVDFVRFRITKARSEGEISKEKDEYIDQENRLGNCIDNCNLLFFYFAEIILLILLSTVFQKQIFPEQGEQGYELDLYLVPLCLADMNRYNDWETASVLFNLEKESYFELLMIGFFTMTKLITLYVVFRHCYWQRNQSYYKYYDKNNIHHEEEQQSNQYSLEIDLPKQLVTNEIDQ